MTSSPVSPTSPVSPGNPVSPTSPAPSGMAQSATPVLRPTRLGLTFLGLTILTLIGCINYGLSLGYGLTFLLGGIWIVTAAQATYAGRTLRAKLMVTVGASPEQLSGLPLNIPGTIESERGGTVIMLAQATQGQQVQQLSWIGRLEPGRTQALKLSVPAPRRGPLQIDRVRLVAVDPLGLWRATKDCSEQRFELLMAPAPEAEVPTPDIRHSAGQGEAVQRVAGHEEFAGVRGYIPGDTPRMVSWKHTARTGQLMTREYDAASAQGLHLDWEATASLKDTERRLSRMTAWVLMALRQGQPFSLTLPGTALDMAEGEAQTQAAMSALATFNPLPQPPEPAKPPESVKRPAAAIPALPTAPLRFSLLALGVALLPGALRYPFWVSLLLAGLLGYAALQADQTRRLPPVPQLLLVLLAAGAALGLNAQYGTLLGQDAGTAILAVLLTLKAAETRTIRDAQLLSLLALFMTSTHYFHSQGPLTALHSVVATLLALAALSRWVSPSTSSIPSTPSSPSKPSTPGSQGNSQARGQDQKLQSTLATLLRPTGQLMLLSLPLAALLFAFFPRPDSPLWRLPLQGGNQTGLADSITAGSFSNLAQNKAVAFRADFGNGPVPAPNQLYWRGPVYEAYVHNEWKQFRAAFADPTIDRVRTAPVYRYSITLEPNAKPWLLPLDTPLNLPPNAVMTSGFQVATPRPATVRTRYDFQSQQAKLGIQESVDRLNFDLLLPADQSPRARALGESWRKLPPEQRVQAALSYLVKGGFSYSLNAPTLPENNRIDAFLFGTKQGFCEHYSSAFAFLMRAAGVPTRIVGGYLGGEVNPAGNYLIVRQQDAHAWNEVWLQGQGWVRVDPTAAIAPARVNLDVNTALSRPTATTAAPPTPLSQVQLRIDAFQNSWNNLLVSYDGTQQRNLLMRLGLSGVAGGVGSLPYVLGLGVLCGLLLLPILALLRRKPRPSDPALAALLTLTEKLKLPRQPGETVSAYTQRATQAYPAQANLLGQFAQVFNELRYAPAAVAQPQLRRELRRLLRAIKRQS